MTESIFDDIETIAQTPKPRPKVQHMQKNCTCLNCQHFAGRARDRKAVLFKHGKGYCDNPGHHGGVWNVIQDVERGCALFEAAPQTVQDQRRAAAVKLWKERK